MPDDPHDPRRLAASGPQRRLVPWLALVALLLAACSGETPLPGDPLRLVSSSLDDAVLGEAYQEDLVPSGGLRPYDFRLEEGRLPPGIALQGGTLIGTPTAVGRYAFVVAVSDANLSTTFEEYVLTVRELPVPSLELDLPRTEVRDGVRVRGRVENARGLRAVRTRVTWDNARVVLGPDGVRAARDDVAVLFEEREGGVAIDLVALGEPIDGATDLFEIDLRTREAVAVSAEVRTELLYAGRHAYEEGRVGAPPTPDADDEGDEAVEGIEEEPADGASDGDVDDAPRDPEDGDPDDAEAPDGEEPSDAPEDAAGPNAPEGAPGQDAADGAPTPSGDEPAAGPEAPEAEDGTGDGTEDGMQDATDEDREGTP